MWGEWIMLHRELDPFVGCKDWCCWSEVVDLIPLGSQSTYLCGVRELALLEQELGSHTTRSLICWWGAWIGVVGVRLENA